MIISASRRTDIPSFYSEWMLNRLKEEYVLVRNPMNIHQVNHYGYESITDRLQITKIWKELVYI